MMMVTIKLRVKAYLLNGQHLRCICISLTVFELGAHQPQADVWLLKTDFCLQCV